MENKYLEKIAGINTIIHKTKNFVTGSYREAKLSDTLHARKQEQFKRFLDYHKSPERQQELHEALTKSKDNLLEAIKNTLRDPYGK